MIPDPTNGAPADRQATAQAVRERLRLKGFTLYRLAALARTRYPQQSAFHIRRNFSFPLRSGLSPTFQQVLAFSQLTGSPLWDWLRIFGFSLADIPRIQALVARPRTGRIDKDLVDPQGLFPSLHYRQPGRSLPTVAPLSQLLEQSGSCAINLLTAAERRDFVYAKIGTEDALAFPELLPGSIVRADPGLIRSSLSPGRRSSNFFLVEHGRGLNCGQLRVSASNRMAFVTSNASFANVEFRLGVEARILGVVDLELRFRPASEKRRGTADTTARISSHLIEPWNPTPLETRASQRPGALLETARLHAGLSFRSASKLSRTVAKILGDHHYFASSGTLSDYEAGDRMPRHIHKLLTLSIIYSVTFRALLQSFGIALDDLLPRGQTVRWSPSRPATTPSYSAYSF
jgi:transcriptional regulator with XRE-family HTH domain